MNPTRKTSSGAVINRTRISASIYPCPSTTLFAAPQVPHRQRLRPSLLLLLLCVQLLQLFRVQSRVPPLSTVDTLFGSHISNTAEKAAAGELPTDAFSDAALNGLDILVTGDVGIELFCWRRGVSGA